MNEEARNAARAKRDIATHCAMGLIQSMLECQTIPEHLRGMAEKIDRDYSEATAEIKKSWEAA